MKITDDLTDRELLELAGEAAGYEFQFCLDTGKPVIVDMKGGGTYWNPIEDDGDAFRLAVKCRMHVNVYYNDTRVTADDVFLCEMHNGNPHAATRRAIVRAAAEIARSKV